MTGYSIKYAWRSPASQGTDRIVLITDRRVGADRSAPATSPNPANGDLTVIEVHLDGKGRGEAKASYADVVVDAADATLALKDYAAVPTVLKVTR